MLNGSDRISLRGWLADLTYREVHSFTIGLACALAAGFPGLVGVVAVAFGLSALAARQRPRNSRVVRNLRREPWYGSGGAAIGYVLFENGVRIALDWLPALPI